MPKFEPRLTEPTKKDTWYDREGFGGKSPCIAGMPEAWKGSVLANCVGYAFGRVAELMGKFIKIGYSYGNKPYSAHKWYGAKDGLPRGKTPKLGAVACWEKNDGKSGHVALVEKIHSDGSWTSSESSYKGTAFRNKKYPKSSYRAGFKFQGFIYPPIPEEPKGFQVGDKVEITGKGFSGSQGGVSTVKPIGWKREVLEVKPSARYPYRVGSKGITTAWFAASSLKKI